jgi:hypothetical protein
MDPCITCMFFAILPLLFSDSSPPSRERTSTARIEGQG